MAWQVLTLPCLSHSSASLIHCSRVIFTPLDTNSFTALAMMTSTILSLSLASSSLAAVIHTSWLPTQAFLASLSTFLAFS